MAISEHETGTKTAIVSETITGATQADPVVLTITSTALVNGDTILVSGVVGMTEINDRRFTVANKDTNSVELAGEDGTGHTAYTSGGTVTRIHHTLNTTSPETTDGAYQFVIDMNALAIADTVVIRLGEKARSSDTQRQLASWSFSHVQIDPLFVSPTFILLHGWDITLEQSDGTGRAFPWSIRKVV